MFTNVIWLKPFFRNISLKLKWISVFVNLLRKTSFICFGNVFIAMRFWADFLVLIQSYFVSDLICFNDVFCGMFDYSKIVILIYDYMI